MNGNRYHIFVSNNAELIFEYLYTVEEYITFRVYVKSYGFSGASNFCIHTRTLHERRDSMKNLSGLSAGLYEIHDYDSDDFICFRYDEKVLYVTGLLGGSYNDNHMKFSFTADQTVFALIASTFSNFISLGE